MEHKIMYKLLLILLSGQYFGLYLLYVQGRAWSGNNPEIANLESENHGFLIVSLEVCRTLPGSDTKRNVWQDFPSIRDQLTFGPVLCFCSSNGSNHFSRFFQDLPSCAWTLTPILAGSL